MSMCLHSHTPVLNVIDGRGLPVRQVLYWRGEASDLIPEARLTTQRHDVAGRLVEQCDPRFSQSADSPNLTRCCSLSGSELLTNSVDAGWRLGLPGAAGQILERWDSRGSHWQYEFDGRLRPTSVRERASGAAFKTIERLSYADNSAESASHNQSGRLIRHDDPAGALSISDYSLSSTVVEQTRRFLNDVAVPDWPQALAEREALLEPSEGWTSRSVCSPLGQTIEQIDAKGHRQLFRQTVSGQLSEVRLLLAGQVVAKTLVTGISYNADGQVAREVAGNAAVSTRRYGARDGRLIEMTVQARDGSTLQGLHYEYDPVGNVLSIEDKAQPIRYFANQLIVPISRFGYDTLYQLLEASGFEAGMASKGPEAVVDPMARTPYRQTYRYDQAGNLLELTHEGVQGHGHRLVVDIHSNRCLPVLDGVEPTEEDFRTGFDANGNSLQLKPGQLLSWDLRNQLGEVCAVVRETGVHDRERYVYSAEGQRVRKVSETRSSGSTIVAQVRYFPGLEIRSHSGTGELLHVINVEAGHCSIQVLRWESEPPQGVLNDSCRYTFTDHLGSCALELDNVARVITRQTYHPFGSTAACERGEANEDSYRTRRYSGKEQDATGLYYYGFRYYVPWLQRWLNPDPAGQVDGLNYYRMVNNNPLAYADTLGLSAERIDHAEEESGTKKSEVDTHSPRSNATVLDSLRQVGLGIYDRLLKGAQLVNEGYRFLYSAVWGARYQKSITLNYPDFTIKQFELHSPSSAKDVVIQAHGRVRSPVHKIYSASHELDFYTPKNTDLEAAPNDLFRFQARKIEVNPVEIIRAGEESSDYELRHAPELISKLSAFFHHGQLMNRKPAIVSSAHLDSVNFHDVLTIKPGRNVSLSKILKELPAYNKVHCFFCRSRTGGRQAYAPFASPSVTQSIR